MQATLCPRSLDPFDIVTYYLKLAETPWTDIKIVSILALCTRLRRAATEGSPAAVLGRLTQSATAAAAVVPRGLLLPQARNGSIRRFLLLMDLRFLFQSG